VWCLDTAPGLDPMPPNPFHGYDSYRAEKDKAALERATWRKTVPKRGPKQEGPKWRGGLARRKPRPVTLAKVK
jgi:hypothetical protein